MLVWERERERDERREKMRKIVDIDRDRNRDRNRDRDDNQETWTFKILYYTFGWFVVWIATHKKSEVVALSLLISLLLLHTVTLIAGIIGSIIVSVLIMIGLLKFKDFVDKIKREAEEENGDRMQRLGRRGDIVYDFNDLIIVNDLSELRDIDRDRDKEE